jgi:predicted TIM-barrel fold metal-dependent hydrolase
MSGIIDVHSHVFRASDIPIGGFIAGHKDLPRWAGELVELAVEFIEAEESTASPAALVSPGAELGDPDVLLGRVRARHPGLAARMDAPTTGIAPSGGASAAGLFDGLAVARRLCAWVWLTTRSRSRIASVFQRSYPELLLATPLLVDMEHWVNDQPKVDMRTQLLAQRALIESSGGRLHPFMAYCPRRDVRTSGAALDLVKEAVTKHGCIGVKVYPPMGFFPLGNNLLSDPLGAAIDTALENLYAYCAENGVPVTAHCSPGGAESRPGFSQRSHPYGWRAVLTKHPTLRLNLGHFGGYESLLHMKDDKRRWVEGCAELMSEFGSVYADISYHTLAASPGNASKWLESLMDVFKRWPKAKDRLLYGSDWHMIVMEGSAERYLIELRQRLESVFGESTARGFFWGNAVRFLGLEATSPVRERLNAYYVEVGLPPSAWMAEVDRAVPADAAAFSAPLRLDGISIESLWDRALLAAMSVAASADADPADLPAITVEELSALEDVTRHGTPTDLAELEAALSESIGPGLSVEALSDVVSTSLSGQDPSAVPVSAAAFGRDIVDHVPHGFLFPGMDLDAIPIKPSIQRFETVGDLPGWVVNVGPVLRSFAVDADFRWHDDPKYQQGFRYTLPPAAADAEPRRYGLFADFGTGLYHSRYIARHMESAGLAAAFHLGDVYYAGRRREFADYFDAPLRTLVQTTPLFALPGNHETYSRNRPYFESMDARRNLPGQVQQGSYFVVDDGRVRFIGIDSDSLGHGRYRDPELREWLGRVLQEGRDAGRLNILLTSNEPYALDAAPGHRKDLFRDLAHWVQAGLVDLWFWGNTHHCAVYDWTDETPFVGSCIGHGGYPYKRIDRPTHSPVPLLFVETLGRFPAWTRLRTDMGNNGFCVLTVHGEGPVRLTYVDWMKFRRCEIELTFAEPGKRPTRVVRELGREDPWA